METAIPIGKFNLSKVADDLNPAIKKIESEDEKIASLSRQAGWVALKERIQRKIDAIEDSTKVTSNTMGLVEDIQVYGFKCLAKDLLVEAYQSVIADVDETAKYLSKQKDEQGIQTKE